MLLGKNFYQSIKEIRRMALPIFWGILVNMLALIVNTRVAGSHSSQNYYLLSLFIPFSFIFIAITESLRGVISTKIFSIKQDDARNLTQFFLHIVMTAVMIYALLGLIIFIMKNPLEIILHVSAQHYEIFFRFLEVMIFSSLLMCIATLLSAIIIAYLSPIYYWILITLSTCLNIVIAYFCITYWHGGMNSLALSTASSAVFSIILVLGWLKNKNIIETKSIRFIIRDFILTIKDIATIGLPIFFSYTSIFIAVFFYNYFLSRFSENVVAGYGIATRIQGFITIPAIAIGVASAYLFSRYKAENNHSKAASIYRYGLIMTIMIYGLISLAMFLFNKNIALWFSGDNQIILQSENYFHIISLSYCGLGPMIALIIIAEQTGKSFLGFLINFLYFAFTFMLTRYMIHFRFDPASLYFSISSANFICLVSVIFYLIFHRYKTQS